MGRGSNRVHHLQGALLHQQHTCQMHKEFIWGDQSCLVAASKGDGLIKCHGYSGQLTTPNVLSGTRIAIFWNILGTFLYRRFFCLFLNFLVYKHANFGIILYFGPENVIKQQYKYLRKRKKMETLHYKHHFEPFWLNISKTMRPDLTSVYIVSSMFFRHSYSLNRVTKRRLRRLWSANGDIRQKHAVVKTSGEVMTPPEVHGGNYQLYDD